MIKIEGVYKNVNDKYLRETTLFAEEAQRFSRMNEIMSTLMLGGGGVKEIRQPLMGKDNKNQLVSSGQKQYYIIIN